MTNVEFDEFEYLAANPDVAAAVKEGKFHSGRQHYDICGEMEGRLPKKMLGSVPREDKVFYLLDKNGLGLEIGPSHNPIAPKRSGYNVHILDHMTAEQLRLKYQGHEVYGVKLENIEEVDFVWHGEPFTDLIGRERCYDWIISSHVIEHVPDLISHLQQCEALLKPTGILSLVIPDKRYCFDCFNSSSSTGSVIDAYSERRTRPSHGQIFDHFANASKLNGNIAWSPDMRGGADELIHGFDQAKALLAQSYSSPDYIDAHCWRFTPASFRVLISDLQLLDLINLEIRNEFDTTGCEFFVSLGIKTAAPVRHDRLAMLQKMKRENT